MAVIVDEQPFQHTAEPATLVGAVKVYRDRCKELLQVPPLRKACFSVRLFAATLSGRP
jgi:hypothetical protein